MLAGGMYRGTYDLACAFIIGLVLLTLDFISPADKSGRFFAGKCILSAFSDFGLLLIVFVSEMSFASGPHVIKRLCKSVWNGGATGKAENSGEGQLLKVDLRIDIFTGTSN